MKTAETKETVLNDEEHRDEEIADDHDNHIVVDGEEVIEKDGVVNIVEEDNESHSYDPNRISLYGRPRQRQKWGDTQVLPRANWGCTFFDLFFVGGAYNVGNVLLQDPSGQGVLYFCGCFFVLSSMWLDKTNFDSKFALEDDVFHRCREMLSFLLVAGAVLHIREVEIMSNPCEHPEMFVFALIVCLHLILSMLSYLEIYLFCKGDRFALKASSYQEIKRRLATFIFFATAAIIAGIEYFKENTTTNYDDKNSDNRYLAADDYSGSSKCSPNNIPIYLCLAGFLFENFMLIFIVQFYFRNLGRDGFGSHKKRYVPVNVGFIIHRNSEWNMLMLGESVLSLLIVPSSKGFRYYVAFFSGILTVMLLQYLHYRSQPHDASSHALRRHKDAGVWWRFTYQIYSCSIVAIGVSFKLFMYNFTVQDDYDDDVYYGGGEQYNNNTSYGDGSSRMLAGGTSDSFSNRPAMAKIFGIAMATTFFCIDGLTLLHNGLQKGYKRCECQRTKRKNIKGIMLTILRVLVIIFFATLGFYVTNPMSLCLLGVCGCLVQLVIRSLGLIYFADTMHA